MKSTTKSQAKRPTAGKPRAAKKTRTSASTSAKGAGKRKTPTNGKATPAPKTKISKKVGAKTAKRTTARPGKTMTAATKGAKTSRISAAKRPTKAAATPAKARKARAGAVVIGKNPLIHRGTKPSRTQLLIEHQAAPMATTAHAEIHGTESHEHDSNLGVLVRETEIRNRARKAESEGSRGQRVRSVLATSANARIGGHASSSGRRTQGRRDAAQRGEKRPGMGQHSD